MGGAASWGVLLESGSAEGEGSEQAQLRVPVRVPTDASPVTHTPSPVRATQKTEAAVYSISSRRRPRSPQGSGPLSPAHPTSWWHLGGTGEEKSPRTVAPAPTTHPLSLGLSETKGRRRSR